MKLSNMDAPVHSPSESPDQIDPYEDGLETLFEELSLAIRWQRPSILLAFCSGEALRVEAALALEKRLSAIGQKVILFELDERQFDAPLALSRHPDRRKSVYFVSGLSRGGGREEANAYRALNMRRELLVDRRVRAVFWLDREEAVALPQHAPDFWAFRHRVVEFDQAPLPQRAARLAGDLSRFGGEGPGGSKYPETRLALHEALLSGLPGDGSTRLARAGLLFALAGLHRAKGEPARSLKLLKKGLGLSKRLKNPGITAAYWGNLGLLYNELRQTKKALQAYQKAVQLASGDGRLWVGLGQAHLHLGRAEAAASAFRKAGQLDPGNAAAWNGLGLALQTTGRTEEALEACRETVRLDPKHAEAWGRLSALHLDLGQLREARRAGKKAARLNPGSAGAWEELGRIQRLLGNLPDALLAYRNGLSLEPDNFTLLASLAACHRLAGQDDLAAQQIQAARSVMKDQAEYDRAAFEAVCGNTNKAVELLAAALQKGQARAENIRSEPNFDFIREDPRFKALLEK